MRFRLAVLSAALSCSAAAWATQVQVTTPTEAPYTRFEQQVAPGSFADTYRFSLSQATTGYLWLFARQEAWFGFNLTENTERVSLTLRNDSTQALYNAVLYPTTEGVVSVFTPGVLPMVVSGFDPNRSLYLAGTFGPGSYTATVAGLATGSAGSSYILKVNMPGVVPEPGTLGLLALGLGGLAWVARRRQG